ncbi:MAG: agmatine/peptidylarginine deiminase [Geminicoccaceae bacterium]
MAATAGRDKRKFMHDGNDERRLADDGWRMPAEWERHERCLIAWPPASRPFGGDEPHRAAKRAYGEVAAAVQSFEPVTVLVDPTQRDEARRMLTSDVELIGLPLDDGWMRDTGPTFLLGEGCLAGIDWRFNGWGQSGQPWAKDDLVAPAVTELAGARSIRSSLVLEGGALHTDGAGLLLTTDSVLFDPRRNGGVAERDILSELQTLLHVDTVLRSPWGWIDDETGGHIDNVACFAPGNRILIQLPETVDDPNWPRGRDLAARLEAQIDNADLAKDILVLPAPRPRRRHDGTWLTRSYINHYVANGAVIAPTFGDPADEVAHARLRQAYPDRELICIDANGIVEGGGGIHCITLQQPAPGRPSR